MGSIDSPSPPPYILPAPPSPSAPMFPMCVHCGYGSAEPAKNLLYPCGYYHAAHVRCHVYYTTNAENRNTCIVCKSENCTVVVYDSSEQKQYTEIPEGIAVPLPPIHATLTHATLIHTPPLHLFRQPSNQDCCSKCVYIYLSCCAVLIIVAIILCIYAYSTL
jgi:hypothetical protein